MKSRYDSIAKLKLLAGDVYDVADFLLWWLTLPFYMGYDLVYFLLKIIYKSTTLRLFIKSSFSQLAVCSFLFVLILFAPFPFPFIAIVGIRSILLIALILLALNGLRILDNKYQVDEARQETKMLADLRKQINVGVPDQLKEESIEENLEMLTLKVRLAELEARQATLAQELDLKRQSLDLEAIKLKQEEEKLASPLYQLKGNLEARKAIVSEIEITKKEEDLGLRERPRDKDLTEEEKIAIGMPKERQASTKQVKIVRVLEAGLKGCGYSLPKLYLFTSDRIRTTVGFSVIANVPKLADEEAWLESLARQADSLSVQARIKDKAVEFYLMNRPYLHKEADPTGES